MPLFLELPQINQMKIESFGFAGNSKDGSKYEVKEAAIFRLRDEGSVALFKAAVNGERFDEAVVVAKKSSEVLWRYKMKLAFIETYQTEDNGISESLGLRFTTLVVE
jgi:type VI protein secretion system component Hcp